MPGAMPDLSSAAELAVSTTISIAERVETFLRNREDYHRTEYREHQVRQEFVDALFQALGWDMTNRAGYAESYKDVVTELPTRIGTTLKAPDYAFRVGGIPKFLVEAKRPSVNVGTSSASSFQLRRYGFSMGLPFGIVTDFEEFAVYDTSIRPDREDPSDKGRIRIIKCDQYLEHWDWISSLFSRDAILRGNFDRYAQHVEQGRKSTGGVDNSLLSDIEKWREDLAQDLAHKNPWITLDQLNLEVQKLIDRIVFLRIAEDRGTEPYEQLRRSLTQEPVSAYAALLRIFRVADGRYNSGLFHFENEAGRVSAPDIVSTRLKFDNKLLRRIIESLYYPYSPYEFSVIPPEILGRVYEKFIGKTIRFSRGRKIVVEDKPEVRLAGGVYYTPTYVIEYIVDRTLQRLLMRRAPAQLDGKSSVRSFRVLDPACGSGSFLLGAYDFLLRWYRDEYTKNNPEREARRRPARLYRGPEGQWRLTLSERKRILLAHIFGVDRDRQAVEVTKLSLLLKVLEGARDSMLTGQLELFREQMLPDLDSNIKCGNSLVEYDDGSRLRLNGTDPFNPFDWHAEFPDALRQGGFDAVIGNPPYVRIQRIPHEEADYLFRKYATVAGKTDLSTIFMERSLQLCKQAGLVGLICTSQWTATDYGKGLRELLGGGRVQSILSFGSLPVFQEAETYPAIFIFGHATSKSVEIREISRVEDLRLTALNDAPRSLVPSSRLGGSPWNLKPFDLGAHVEARKLPVLRCGEIASAAIGVITGMNDAFVLTADQANQLLCDIVIPYVDRGRSVRAFTEIESDRWLIYPYASDPTGRPTLLAEQRLRREYPEVYKHLYSFRSKLRQRQDSRRLYASGADWYRHLRAGTFSLINSEKFVLKGIDTRSTFGLLRAGVAFNGTNVPALSLHGLTRQAQLELLAILNSKLIAYHLRATCPPKLGGFTRLPALE